MLRPSEIDALVQGIVARTDPETVIVFGSYAKGNATSTSDLDLLLIRQTDEAPARRADAVRPLLASLLVRVDVHVYTLAEIAAYRADPLSFISSVLRTGRIAYQRGDSRSFIT
ncbi:MAG: nucleotidyltransferase domain-containing protein [Bdellovibrionales bacterium]|nr:nucleotidyltransferase domain-containing protein [Massilia sp.]